VELGTQAPESLSPNIAFRQLVKHALRPLIHNGISSDLSAMLRLIAHVKGTLFARWQTEKLPFDVLRIIQSI
jgi:hypothetical protein